MVRAFLQGAGLTVTCAGTYGGVFAGWEELGSPAARAPSILCKCSCLSELPASSERAVRAGLAGLPEQAGLVFPQH